MSEPLPQPIRKERHIAKRLWPLPPARDMFHAYSMLIWRETMRRLAVVATALTLCACAQSSTMPMTADTFQLLTSAAPVCGRWGYPIIGGKHNQALVVRMFKDGDPRGANAISARGTLGRDWQEAVKEGATTTC